MDSGQRLLASASILACAADCDSPFRVAHSNVSHAAIDRTKSDFAELDDHIERRLIRFPREVVFFAHAPSFPARPARVVQTLIHFLIK